MAVSLQQLRYFLAVAQEGSITAGARRLHIAQPALSQAMHALERDLGVELLERHRHGVTPTPAGARFATAAATAVRAVDEAVASVRREAGPRLVVGIQPGAPLDGVLSGFRSAFPEVGVQLRALTFVNELSAIRDGEVDVGFVFPGYRDDGLVLEPLAEVPAVVCAGWDTLLARERVLRFEQIADEPMPGQHPAMPDAFADAFWLTDVRGHRPAVVRETPTTVADTIEVLASGRAIAVAPAGIRLPVPSVVATVPLTGVPPFRLSLAYRAGDGSPAVAAFASYIRSFSGPAWARL